MASIHENDKMTSKSIFPFDECKPLTEQEIYTDASLDGDWLDEVFDKKDVLCALKGMKEEQRFILYDYTMAKINKFETVERLKNLPDKWFPILQSRDDGDTSSSGKQVNTNATTVVETPVHDVGGSEQTSNYDALDDFCHSLGEPDYDGENQIRMHWKELSEKVHAYLLSQPSGKTEKSMRGTLGTVGSDSGTHAGELSKNQETNELVEQKDVKDAGESPSHIFRRFRCVHCDRFFHKEERAGSNEGKPVCRECIDCNEEEEVGGRT